MIDRLADWLIELSDWLISWDFENFVKHHWKDDSYDFGSKIQSLIVLFIPDIIPAFRFPYFTYTHCMMAITLANLDVMSKWNYSFVGQILSVFAFQTLLVPVSITPYQNCILLAFYLDQHPKLFAPPCYWLKVKKEFPQVDLFNISISWLFCCRFILSWEMERFTCNVSVT